MITIAIDGPSAAGKGVVSDEISKRLGIYHLDTGAIYRAVGLYCYENNVDARSEEEVSKVLDDINIEIKFDGLNQLTYLNGECINHKIRNSIISDYASRSSALQIVRDKVRDLQRDFAKNNSVVMEGRDITTVVLPDAKYKFFLTASPEVRAQRRLKDYLDKGENKTYEEVLEDLKERDLRDSTKHRLIITEDTELINTDNYTVEEVVNLILCRIKEK